MNKEILLNVSQLPPCEPLERVLDALPGINAGQYLRVLHSREPYPLYDILHNRGYDYYALNGSDTPFEIYIWQSDDNDAYVSVWNIVDT